MAEDEKKSIKAWEGDLPVSAFLEEWEILEEKAAICIGQHPESELGHFFLGRAKNGLKRYEEAIADFNKAIQINDKFDVAYYLRGSTKAELKQFEEAIADFDRAIEINDRFGKAYIKRGDANDIQGLYKEAIADYDKAIEVNPADVDARDNRAAAIASLRAQETQDKILEAYEKNIKTITATDQILSLIHI